MGTAEPVGTASQASYPARYVALGAGFTTLGITLIASPLLDKPAPHTFSDCGGAI